MLINDGIGQNFIRAISLSPFARELGWPLILRPRFLNR